jgi:hypothetical protein
MSALSWLDQVGFTALPIMVVLVVCRKVLYNRWPPVARRSVLRCLALAATASGIVAALGRSRNLASPLRAVAPSWSSEGRTKTHKDTGQLCHGRR